MSNTVPSVDITVSDNGVNTTLQLPQQQVQVVLGCAVGGTPFVPYATTSATALQSQFVGGPLVQAAGLVCAAGGTVIACRLPITTPGTATAVTPSGTGTSVMTLTLDGTNGAWDDANVQVTVITGGTIGVTGCQIQVSYDAGRSHGPVLNLLTAVTFALTDLGVTLDFAAGTLVAGDTYRFSTVAPAWSVADISTALNALKASPFAVSGWGSSHLVGVTSGSDAQTVNNAIDNLKANYIFSRIMLSARDAHTPVAWGGAGETEATWMTALETAASTISAKREVYGAGYYNTPSAYSSPIAGLPSYRRSGVWSVAVRRTQVPPQQSSWRVRSGALTNIVVNATSDPGDGFVYHNEATTPGLANARYMTFRTWPKKPGIFVTKDLLMSPPGSQFTILPLGNVIDVACDIGYEVGVEEVGDDLLLNTNGTLQDADRLNIQNNIQAAINDQMRAVGMISSALVVVQVSNVQSTGIIPIDITVTPKGYPDTITERIGLSVPNAAPTS
jgi:hypothetical protein